MAKKIYLFLGGVVAGLLAFLGIRTFSGRYRKVKKQLQLAESKLNSIEEQLGIAEELGEVSTGEIEKLRSRAERERHIISSIGTELADNENILADCELRIADCERVLADCEAILGKPADF